MAFHELEHITVIRVSTETIGYRIIYDLCTRNALIILCVQKRSASQFHLNHSKRTR